MRDWKGYRLRRRDNPWVRPRRGPHGFLEGAGWLADGVLLLSGWLTSSNDRPMTMAFELAGTTLETEAMRFTYPRADLEGLPAGRGQVFVAPLGEALPETFRGRDLQTLERVLLEIDDAWYRYVGGRDLSIGAEANTIVGTRLSLLEPPWAERLAEFLETCRDRVASSDDPLYESNRASWLAYLPPEEDEEAMESEDESPGLDEDGEPGRDEDQEEEESEVENEEETEAEDAPEDDSEAEAEEEALSNSIADPRSSIGLSVDHLFALDGRTLLVQGWSWDADEKATALLCHPPDGGEPVVLDSPWRLERGDVSAFFEPAFGGAANRQLGRIDRLRLAEPLSPSEHLRFELVLSDGTSCWVGSPRPETDPWRIRDHLLRVAPSLGSDDPIFEGLVEPSLDSLQPRCAAEVDPLESVLEYAVPSSPKATLIVPICQELELIEHQMASFAGDAELDAAEILYALDAPEHREVFERQLFHLARLYRLPVRGFVNPRNVGYAATVTRAVAEARGPLLVLLHGDVLAAGPGWLGRLVETVARHDDLGAVGFRLVSEHRSLRHAGIHFEREALPGRLWAPCWDCLGLPDTLPAANEEYPVAALSGACLAMATERFHQLGGLADRYVAGDLEDLDLCLRALEAGHTNRYLPNAFYHFGGLGKQEGEGWRRNPWSERYNQWLFDHRWAAKLDQGLAELDGV